MLHDIPYRREKESLWMEGGPVKFSLESEGTKVNMHAIHASLGLMPTSWETTVTSRTLDTFAFRETSFVT